jgi:hypothetical protein
LAHRLLLLVAQRRSSRLLMAQELLLLPLLEAWKAGQLPQVLRRARLRRP